MVNKLCLIWNIIVVIYHFQKTQGIVVHILTLYFVIRPFEVSGSSHSILRVVKVLSVICTLDGGPGSKTKKVVLNATHFPRLNIVKLSQLPDRLYRSTSFMICTYIRQCPNVSVQMLRGIHTDIYYGYLLQCTERNSHQTYFPLMLFLSMVRSSFLDQLSSQL